MGNNDIWLRPSEKRLTNGDEVFDVSSGAFTLQVCAAQLQRIEDPVRQRELFKNFVKRVVIETSSYCNRRCIFCPNSDGSRLSAHRMMPQEMFVSIIGELAEIEYDRVILFHLYNEPLANPAIYQQIALARQRLPNARLSFNTNGDYIRPETLGKLVAAGLSSLHISIYGPGHGIFDPEYVHERVADMAATCGLGRESATWINQLECRAMGVYSEGKVKLPITIQARNFSVAGYDRGGLVEVSEPTPDRMMPCPSPFDEVLLTWDGTAVPCCNIVGDKPEHHPFTVGSIGDLGSIFRIYADGPQVDWRRGLLRFGRQRGPCAQCTRLSTPVHELDNRHLAFNAAADRLLEEASPLALSEIDSTQKTR